MTITDKMLHEGAKAIVQCTESESGDYSLKLWVGYQADAERAYKAMQAVDDRQAQLEKDAERYRWLRDDSGAECAVADYWCSCDKKVEITDEAIDAAIAAQAQGVGND